jgi:integrase
VWVARFSVPGLRRAELTRLKITDIDSARNVMHVQGGKGRKDRDVMLSDDRCGRYRFGEPIGRISGETAMNIIIRLSSFILLCIGVQILWNGASALPRTILVHAST